MAEKPNTKTKITEYFGKSPVRFESVKQSTKRKNECINDAKEAMNGNNEGSVNDIKEDMDKENEVCVESISNDIEPDESHGEIVNDDKSSEMHFPCSNCDFITGDENEIRIHMDECAEPADINTQSFNSDEITQNDADLSLTVNNDSLTESQFPCSNCDYSTADLNEIASHMATCTDQNDSKTTPIDMIGSKENVLDINLLTKAGDGMIELHFTCSNCDFIGLSEDEVLGHMKSCTDDYDLKTQPYYTVYKHDLIKKTYKFIYSSQDQETNKKVLANKINQTKGTDKTSSKQKLKRMRIIYTKSTKEKEESRRKRVQTEKGSDYNQLMKKFKRPLKKEYVCDICEFKTDNKNYIEQHVTKVHSDDKPIACTECEYRCKRHGDLKSHMLVHQQKVRDFVCKICSWATYRSSKLKLHMRKHTGETPYQCPMCDYSSYKSDGLASHMKMHSLDRPHKCDVCGSAFKQAHNLNAHMMIHTGNQPKNYLCKLCDYACGTPHVLKNHMLTHTSERPHECPKCNYTCKIKSNLAVHMLKHTKQKPYVCFECGFSTKLPQTLKRHNKIHTREHCALDPVKLRERGEVQENKQEESVENEMIYIKSEF